MGPGLRRDDQRLLPCGLMVRDGAMARHHMAQASS